MSAYANKGRLLRERQYRELADSAEIGQVVAKLRGSDYESVLSELEQPYTPRRIEMALRRRLVDLHFKMLKESKESPLIRSYYWKYTVRNMKTLLKGLARGRAYEELQEYIDLYAEERVGRRDLLVRTLQADSLEGVVEKTSGYILGEDVQRAVELYKDTADVSVFETVLDKTFLADVASKHSELRGHEGRRVRALVAQDVDFYHTMATLRGISWSLGKEKIQDLWIDCFFDVGRDQLSSMAESDQLARAARELEKTVYSRVLPPSLETTSSSLLSMLEDGFVDIDLQRSRRAFLRDILSQAVLLAILRLKEREIAAVVGIAVGVGQGLSPRKTMEGVRMPLV